MLCYLTHVYIKTSTIRWFVLVVTLRNNFNFFCIFYVVYLAFVFDERWLEVCLTIWILRVIYLSWIYLLGLVSIEWDILLTADINWKGSSFLFTFVRNLFVFEYSPSIFFFLFILFFINIDQDPFISWSKISRFSLTI